MAEPTFKSVKIAGLKRDVQHVSEMKNRRQGGNIPDGERAGIVHLKLEINVSQEPKNAGPGGGNVQTYGKGTCSSTRGEDKSRQSGKLHCRRGGMCVCVENEAVS